MCVQITTEGGEMGKFNLMSYIMPPEDKMFFTYFQESAEICCKTAELYNEIMEKGLNEDYKNQASEYKKKGKVFYKTVLKQLNKSFITPIEREDIQTIAVQLYKIAKRIAKTSINLEVYYLESYTDKMKEQAQNLLKATDKLKEIICEFKKVSDVEKITQLSIEMKELETNGDDILREAYKILYSGQYETLEVIKLRDLYKEVEKVLDACYFVSDLILNIVLKQS